MVLAAGAQGQELAGGEAEREALAADLAGEGLVEVSVAPVEVAGVALAARLMQAVSGTQAKAPGAADLVQVVGERAAVAV